MALRIFCDFDGTIVHQDVGDTFFRSFGGDQAVGAIEGYRTGRLHAKECLATAVSSVGHVRRDEFERFVDQFSVDQTFGAFLAWAESQGASVTVVSDGLDLYVERILSSSGFSQLTVRANSGEFDPSTDTGLSVSFPWQDEVCEECAN